MPAPPITARGTAKPTGLGLAAILPASLVVGGLLLAAVFLAFPGKPEARPELEIATGRSSSSEAATLPPAVTPAPPPPTEQPPPPPPTEPPFRLVDPPAGSPMWEMAGGTQRELTPEFPLECTAQQPGGGDGAGVTPCVMRVPMYVMILNQVKEAFNLTVIASKVSTVVQRNATHETRVVVQTVFVDNTGCGRKNRVRHPQANHFESHAELVGSDFDCAEWSDTVEWIKKQRNVEVITPSVPLSFGPTQNFIQQDALERRGVPRYMWAHADAAVDGPDTLVRLALVATAVRHPFCVVFSHYDIIAVFDAYSVAREVGDWDAHLWYHGDIDFYGRCRHAKLPWGEASGHDVHHVAKGSTTVHNENLGRKVMKRFQTLGRMYQEYHHSRGATLDIAPFDLPPKNKTLFGAWVNFRDAQRIPSPAAGLADVVSRHMGRWMYPYRFVVRREEDAEGGVARLAVKLEYLPVDLAREDSPVSGEQAQQDLRASLVAATHADEADIYIPR